jgi:hypothetical protein
MTSAPFDSFVGGGPLRYVVAARATHGQEPPIARSVI